MHSVTPRDGEPGGGPPTQFRQIYFEAKSLYQMTAPREDRWITEEPLNRRTSRKIYRQLKSRVDTVRDAVVNSGPPVSSQETARPKALFPSLIGYFRHSLKFKLPNSTRLKIASLNVEGLYDSLKYELLKQYMANKKIDVLALQETHGKCIDSFISGEYSFFFR